MSVQSIDIEQKEFYEKELLRKAMPPSSLGQLSQLSVRLALIDPRPLNTLSLLLFAGDHGIVEEMVTHSPKEITYQQCVNFAQGGGACSLFAKTNGVELTVVDVGVDHLFKAFDHVLDKKIAFGTRNFAHTPAMTEEQALAAMEVGRSLVREKHSQGFDAIAFGEMGVGNTTSSAALSAALTGFPVSSVTGRGSGLSDEELRHKCQVIEAALQHFPQRDVMTVLCNFGGFEIGAIAGGILEACSLHLPVLLDGFITTSAALVSCALEPACKDYLIASHLSGTQGHDLLLSYLGINEPVLRLDMQLGEGTGALVAWPIISLASRILSQMTTFSEARVTDSTAILQEIGLV
ncbi:MAG: nicotinate-nucleotide--dimethylbenzimidazole phosphoribosyltransferase [Sphaerochaeta sp.]